MTFDEAKAAITGKLIEAYGFSKGVEVSGVVAGPILYDFMKMLEKALPGEEVSEEYKTEDLRAKLVLKGRRGEIVSVELV